MLPEEVSAFNWSADINLYSLVINMLIGAVLSGVLRFHYNKFGTVLTNRDELGHIFPMITLVIILIISIVKSSLALSLGLVGALSIVRFRTPIKEPEELGYLFFCIAVGLGLGASQREATILCFIITIILMSLVKWNKRSQNSKSLHMMIQWNDQSSNQSGFKHMKSILNKYTKTLNLRRFDIGGESSEVSFILDLKSDSDIDPLVSEIQKDFSGANIVFLDQKHMPKI